MSNKNKIYAAVSISVVILTAASFFAAISFLLKINNLVFNVDAKIVKEQTTVFDKDGFERIKNKLNPGKNSIEEKSVNTSENVNISPSPALSLAPTVSPSSEVTSAPTLRE